LLHLPGAVPTPARSRSAIDGGGEELTRARQSEEDAELLPEAATGLPPSLDVGASAALLVPSLDAIPAPAGAELGLPGGASPAGLRAEGGHHSCPRRRGARPPRRSLTGRPRSRRRMSSSSRPEPDPATASRLRLPPPPPDAATTVGRCRAYTPGTRARKEE
jgi:hypothetical protein